METLGRSTFPCWISPPRPNFVFETFSLRAIVMRLPFIQASSIPAFYSFVAFITPYDQGQDEQCWPKLTVTIDHSKFKVFPAIPLPFTLRQIWGRVELKCAGREESVWLTRLAGDWLRLELGGGAPPKCVRVCRVSDPACAEMKWPNRYFAECITSNLLD